MRDNFDEDETIIARLITVDRDARCPMLSKGVIRNCTDLNYKGIPVIIIDGYFLGDDRCGNSVVMQGNLVTDRALDVLSKVHKAVKEVDLSSMRDAAFGFILVYAVNDLMKDAISDTSPINLIEVSKLKIRFKKFELQGVKYYSKSFVALTDEDDDDKKCFIVDTEVE